MTDLNKVLSGIIIVRSKNGLITIRQPCAQIRYAADFFASNVYNEAFEENVFLSEELEEVIIKNGWWTQLQQDRIDAIPKEVEQMKLDYYNSFHRSEIRAVIKKAIKKKELEYEELQKEKHTLFSYTCESLMSQAYTAYVIQRCSFFEDGSQVDFSKIGLNGVISQYYAETLSDEDLRELSKSYKWRMIWNASKVNVPIFSLPACDLTEMQQSLISWTRTYDNIYESMEVPQEEIINDNYAIDGWFISQRKKREDQIKESSNQQLPQTGEVLLVAKNIEDAKRINEMNTETGKRIIKSKMTELKQKGSMDEIDFSHTQQELQMKANQAVFNKGR